MVGRSIRPRDAGPDAEFLGFAEISGWTEMASSMRSLKSCSVMGARTASMASLRVVSPLRTEMPMLISPSSTWKLSWVPEKERMVRSG